MDIVKELSNPRREYNKLKTLLIILCCFSGIAYAQYVSQTIQQRLHQDQVDVELDLIDMGKINNVDDPNYQLASQDMSQKLLDVNSIINDNSATSITNSLNEVQTVQGLR